MSIKRCTKGKSCGATCIDARKRCVLELGPLISAPISNVKSLIQTKQKDKGSSSLTRETVTPIKSVTPKEASLPSKAKEDINTEYERLMELARAKTKESNKAMAKGDRETYLKLRAEARALSTEAIDLKYGPKKDTPSPVKPVTPKEAPLPPKVKKEEEPKLSLPDAEKILRNYILGGSMETGSMLETNMKLRGVSKTKITPEEQEQVKAMDRLLNTLPRNNGETHYRGFYLDPTKDKAFIESLIKGGTILDNGFSSYSRDREQAEMFADQGIGKPFIIVSRSPQLRDVRKYAPEDYDDQQESIMPRGTALKILKTETRDGITYLYTD